MPFAFHHMKGGGVPVVKEYPAKASEVHVKGTPVNLESGLACVGAAADTAFVGIANETLTAAADGEMLEVIECNARTVFKVDYTEGTKTSLTNADIGTAFDLKSDDVDNIDLDDTTGGAWVVEDFDNDNNVAYVTCLSTKRAATVL